MPWSFRTSSWLIYDPTETFNHFFLKENLRTRVTILLSFTEQSHTNHRLSSETRLQTADTEVLSLVSIRSSSTSEWKWEGFSASPQDLLLPRHPSMVICLPHDTACWTLASINSGHCKPFSTQHLLIHVSVAGAYRTLREFAMTGDMEQHAQAPLYPVSTSSPTTFSYHKWMKTSEKRCGFEWHPLLSLGVELPPFLHTCWRESAQISGSLGWAAGPKMFLTSSQLPVSGLHLGNKDTTLAHSPWTHFPCLLPS